MAIFGIKKDIELSVDNKEIDSNAPFFKSELSDSLPVHLPGYRWEVTYLHRSSGDNNLTKTFDANLDPTLQNYDEVKNLLLRVESANTSNSTDGSAVIDVDFKPTPNDVIIDKTINGDIMLYTITSVDRNIMTGDDNIYNIEYTGLEVIDTNNDELYASLLNSVNQTYYYNSDYRLNQVKPLYLKEEYILRRDLLFKIQELDQYWLNSFVNSEHDFHIVFNNFSSNTLDPFLEDFAIKVTSVLTSCSNVDFMSLKTKEITILDKILENKISNKRIFKYFDNKPSATFGSDPKLRSLIFSNISHVVNVSKSLPPTKIDIVSTEVLEGVKFPITSNLTYIFRDEVYKAIIDDVAPTLTLALFESEFLKMMQGENMDINNLNILYDEIFNLEEKELFYFIPIYIYMLKYYINVYTIQFLRK